jgi:hypothetical protein
MKALAIFISSRFDVSDKPHHYHRSTSCSASGGTRSFGAPSMLMQSRSRKQPGQTDFLLLENGKEGLS